MGFEESRGYCQSCQQWTLVRRETPNHILHFLVTMLTCFVWALFWLVIALDKRPWRCSTCGGAIAKGEQETEYQIAQERAAREPQ